YSATQIATSVAYIPVRLCMTGFFFSSRRRHTRSKRDWSSDVCSSDLAQYAIDPQLRRHLFTQSMMEHSKATRVYYGSTDVVFHQIGRASCRERVEISEGAV